MTTPDPEARPILVRREDGEPPVLECPHCGATNSIVEHDRCDRYNPIEVHPDQLLVVRQEDTEFHTVAWLCEACCTDVSLGDLEDSVRWY